LRQNGIPEPDWLDKPASDWPSSAKVMYGILADWAIRAEQTKQKKGDAVA
jgi:hypothetical protein